MSKAYNYYPKSHPRYKHYESIEGVFYNRVDRHKIVSVNGFAININQLNEDFRITRFIRDPRDLIVSGYFYHKRGAEPWFRYTSPSNRYWSPINGNVPTKMPKGVSYSEYLQKLPLEEGLLAEIEFRKFHIESMTQWPNDERIKVYRYEDILGNEKEIFSDIFKFYELPTIERKIGTWLAGRYALDKQVGKSKHIRNASSGQWENIFTPKVNDHFNELYKTTLESLQYDTK